MKQWTWTVICVSWQALEKSLNEHSGLGWEVFSILKDGYSEEGEAHYTVAFCRPKPK